MRMSSIRATVSVGLLAASPLLGISCGGSSAQTSNHLAGGPSSDAGASPSDGGQKVFTSVDAAGGGGCALPAAPADLCAALPTGKVSSCSQDSSGQPSQTGYLEIDIPGSSPTYVCATSWGADPSTGYVYSQPGTFMSEAQSCCGGAAASAASPTAPQPSIGDLGTLRAPTHLKPQETAQRGSGPIRHDPFAMTVTDTKSGAAATAAVATWRSWAGDGKAHAAPGGTGAYYFAANFPVNYVILETGDGLPVIVIGPEVSLAADGSTPIGHPTLGACQGGGGAPVVLTAGELDGTTLTNHSGRFDYGPSITEDVLANTAKLFNCVGIQVTQTKYYPPKS
jgi:hypothetical protein